jgi:hypothetical protein
LEAGPSDYDTNDARRPTAHAALRYQAAEAEPDAVHDAGCLWVSVRRRLIELVSEASYQRLMKLTTYLHGEAGTALTGINPARRGKVGGGANGIRYELRRQTDQPYLVHLTLGSYVVPGTL